MKSLYCYVINSLCSMLYKNEYNKYISVKNIEKAQKDKLFSILSNNSNTLFGKNHEFKSIKTINDFQRHVPISAYEDYLPYIDRIKIGEKNILTEDEVLLFEKTSGSVSKSKLIPYTEGLKSEFQSGIKPWIYNLYNSIPEIKWGKSYWSVTPVASTREYTECGIPIGFEEDSEYFGFVEKNLIDRIFVTPKDIANEKDMDKFYFKTLHHLLSCKSLTLISIWNPTLLFLLLEYLDKNKGDLLDSLVKSRRNEIKEFVINKEYNKIWPNLKVISCWCDGNSKSDSEKLKILFKDVYIQPKGLLSTEAFVSFTFVNEKGARLSYNSHFFEFLSLEDNNIYLAHELKVNQIYQVILTTSGGLYRYNLMDTIKVVDKNGNTPLFIFTGRKDKVSDLFGEKLNEDFVKETIDSLRIKNDFYMVAPESDKYILYIKTDEALPDIDKLFRENFHYDYCRKLGQLKKLKVFKVTGNPDKAFLDEGVKRGQRMGDIKRSILSLKGGYEKVFQGKFIDN